MGSSDPVIEAEFTIQDSAYPFTGASGEEECTFELARMTPRPDSQYAEFFNVFDADPARILALADGRESVDATLITEYDSGGFFEFLVSENCPAFRLAELGALPRTVRGVHGEGRIIVDIPPQHDSATVIETFLDEHSAARLASKRRKDDVDPIFTRSAFQQVLETHLTDRQREVLSVAFEAGYYDWPRGCTGEDVAEELGITSATFSEQIHAAERNLLSAVFGRE